MDSLTSLPCVILMQIFSCMNQHQSLALGPLHSSLHLIAKSKLFRNLFLYISTQLGPRVAPTGTWEPEFKFHTTINNKKSVKYTIEILDCLFILLECVVRHFQFILYFEIVQRRNFFAVFSDGNCWITFNYIWTSLSPKHFFDPIDIQGFTDLLTKTLFQNLA